MCWCEECEMEEEPVGMPDPPPNYSPPPDYPILEQPQRYVHPLDDPDDDVVELPPMPIPARPRYWRFETCDCMENRNICMQGCCCCLCLACRVSVYLEESAMVPCCVTGGLSALRTKYRTQENIQGSICQDCLITTFCYQCALCQLASDMDAGREPIVYNDASSSSGSYT